MRTDLLASKFYYPPHRPDFVQRPQILATLNAGLRGKLTLVSAPAGFGKTTVVSEWIREGGYPAAWLSLDKNDNDPSRFLIYLIAALQRIDPEIGADVQAVLEEPLPPNFEILLTRLMNEMEKLPDKSLLVLDDYHLIDSRPVHDAINFLIEYLPPTVHLVITGRADPPLPISKLRVRGEVNEVRTSQLRFTEKEAAAFLNDRMGFDLPPDDIEALEARTEGWIASLKLAAFSLQGRNDLSGFITEFSGSNRYVIDYLVDEVMARQPEEVQTFLRRTSILERFCAPLCEYVAGSGRDLEIIEHLDRSNLFLIPLDDQRKWYRYHHLFADFLSQRLRATERDNIPELHRRASHWFETEGLADEAIQHAQAAGDMDRATRLVDGIAADLVVRAEVNKLVKLFERLPSELSQGYPMLCIWYAWALLFMGQLEKVEPTLAIAEANPKKVPGSPNKGYVTTVRAYLVTREGDLLRSIQLCEQALEEMSTASQDQVLLIFRGSAVIWLALNQRLLGNLDQARQLFLEAAEINRKAGNFFAALSSYEQLAGLEIIRGHLHQAVDLYKYGLDLMQKWKDTEAKPLGSFIAAAGLQLGLGTVLYQMNELEEATTHIQWSTDFQELGESWGRLNSYTALAYLRQARGEYETSAELLRKAGAIEETITFQRAYPAFQPSPTKLAILLSRARPEMAQLLTDANRRAERLGIHADDQVDFCNPADYLREAFYVDLAWLLLAKDKPAEALPLLSRLLEAAIKMERPGDEMRYLVMISLAHHAVGNTEAALDALGQALALAEPQGYVRLFVDEGQPMAELLRLAVLHKISSDYAGRLLAAFPKEALDAIPIAKEPAVHAQMLAEPLSEREIEVLRLMAEGCKYEEIADKLVISINTVRHHTRNVYGKLGVNSRTQAMKRAKELNLL
jgi:LuxR family transcriptional regulator, maltose regulon positive regulatory protein